MAPNAAREVHVHPLIPVAAFAAGMAVLARRLRRRDAEGDFDVPSSPAARPGLRRFFDYSDEGWRHDGERQP